MYDSPDAFYAKHGVNLSGFKRWLFQQVVRQWMNQNVEGIRGGPCTPAKPPEGLAKTL